MRNPGGYGIIFDSGYTIEEHDTTTCAHCNNVWQIKPKCHPDDLGGMCRLCMKMICPKCVDLGCTPFEKRLEQIEKRDRARRSYGI